MQSITTGAVLALCIALAACQGRDDAAGKDLFKTAPTLSELQNAAYLGIFEQPLTLEAGRWEGEPYVEGGASRPRAGLAGDFYATGDLEGDGRDEAAVVVWESGAGSGSYHYVALLRRDDDEIVNVDTVLVEDRPRILALGIEDDKLVLELIQHGPDDAACCPTQHALRRWSLANGELVEAPPVMLGE